MKFSVAARICARLMAISSPLITGDLKHTGGLWVYIGTPLPNPSGNTGVMVSVCVKKKVLHFCIQQHFFITSETFVAWGSKMMY